MADAAKSAAERLEADWSATDFGIGSRGEIAKSAIAVRLRDASDCDESLGVATARQPSLGFETRFEVAGRRG